MANKTVTRQVSIFINGKEVKNSLGAIGREIGILKGKLRETTVGSEKFNETLADLDEAQKAYKNVNDEIRSTQAELRGTNAELDTFVGGLRDVVSGFKAGDAAQVQQGINGIKGSIKGATKAALAFIATPIGAFITGLTGIALATREWIKYNEAAREANILTEQITNLTGQALDNARVKATALSKTFDVDFNDTLEAAKVLVKEFDITYNEAFDRIQEGLVKGGAANGEFLDSLREYPTFFAAAKFSAEDFQNILNTGIDIGIYKDKLPDAIKEFGLSVTEQSKSSKDALENAFGPEFTERLLTGIREGSISVKDALFLVSEEAERIGLNAQQSQQLTADLFRGAGEDAGGAQKIFEAVNQSLRDQQRELNPTEKAMYDLADAQQAAATAQDNFLRSDGYDKWKDKVLTVFADVKKGFFELLEFTFAREEQEQRIIAEAHANALKKFVSAGFEEFNNYIELRRKRMGEQFDFEAEKESYLASLRASLRNRESEGDEDAAQRLEAQINAIENKYKKELDIENAFNLDKQRLAEEAAKRRQKQREREQQQIDSQIASEKAKREAVINEEYEQRLALQQQYEDQKFSLDEGNYLRKLEIEQQRELAKAETQLERDELKLEHARTIALEELRILEAAELAKVQAVEGAEELKASIREKFTLERERLSIRFAEQEKKLQDDKVKFTQLTESQKLGVIAEATGAAAKILGEQSAAGKAAGVATATINTWQGVTEVWRSPSSLPEPFATISKVASIATVLASGFNAIKNISKTKTPKFYYGGHTGEDAIAYDNHGKITGYVHEKEWVAPQAMTQNPKYAATLTWLENERQKEMKGYFNGGPTSTGALPTPQPDAPVFEDNTSPILERLATILENGIYAKAMFGYEEAEKIEDLNTERKQSSNNATL